MAKRTRKTTAAAQVEDYRHEQATRKNNPPAKIAAEGIVPVLPRARYEYNPHLPPVLRFDQRGGPDRLPELLDKAARERLEPDEVGVLAEAIRRHEPWLEWAGKREQKWFEVDPVALHIHERVSTQAILKVAARQDVERSLFADPEQEYHQAVQFYRHDVDWANRLILGDSLQVMSSLARREDLAGKVQMIYIDPPYGIKFASNFQPEIGPEPKYFKLWKTIGDTIEPAERLPGRAGKPKPEVVYREAEAALLQIAGQWKERFEYICQAAPGQEQVPPVLILVCDNTDIAEVFYRKISGETEEEIVSEQEVDEVLSETDEADEEVPTKRGSRNSKTKTRTIFGAGAVFPEFFSNIPAEKRTIRIDVKLLAAAESEDPSKSKRDAAEALRRIVATVGKPGLPGEHVRCVVSVAMLTEGWDANNVTHILGVRGVIVILEVKGYEDDQDKAKHNAAKRWVTAVNNWGKLGAWSFHVCRNPQVLEKELTHICNSVP